MEGRGHGEKKKKRKRKEEWGFLDHMSNLLNHDLGCGVSSTCGFNKPAHLIIQMYAQG